MSMTIERNGNTIENGKVKIIETEVAEITLDHVMTWWSGYLSTELNQILTHDKSFNILSLADNERKKSIGTFISKLVNYHKIINSFVSNPKNPSILNELLEFHYSLIARSDAALKPDDDGSNIISDLKPTLDLGEVAEMAASFIHDTGNLIATLSLIENILDLGGEGGKTVDFIDPRTSEFLQILSRSFVDLFILNSSFDFQEGKINDKPSTVTSVLNYLSSKESKTFNEGIVINIRKLFSAEKELEMHGTDTHSVVNFGAIVRIFSNVISNAEKIYQLKRQDESYSLKSPDYPSLDITIDIEDQNGQQFLVIIFDDYGNGFPHNMSIEDLKQDHDHPHELGKGKTEWISQNKSEGQGVMASGHEITGNGIGLFGIQQNLRAIAKAGESIASIECLNRVRGGRVSGARLVLKSSLEIPKKILS